MSGIGVSSGASHTHPAMSVESSTEIKMRGFNKLTYMWHSLLEHPEHDQMLRRQHVRDLRNS